MTGLSRPLVMGILNVTPDSFSDGGRFNSHDKIKRQVEQMVLAGADFIDIGGESTRPGALSVSLDEELERVLPAIDIVKSISDIKISVDTYKTEVMVASLNLGVDMINDVNALQSEGALEVVSQANVKVCLMHRLGMAKNMQTSPHYENIVNEVIQFLLNRVNKCLEAGILADNILLDPGFGFDKALSHNIALFKHLEDLVSLGYPVLVGVSRKRMIGELLNDLPMAERTVGSVSAALVAMCKGAKILRVHDVKETVQAIEVAQKLF